MVCENCKKSNFVEGTLQGVSFEPSKQRKKWLTKGVYSIEVKVCIECGHVFNLYLNTDVLKKILKDKN